MARYPKYNQDIADFQQTLFRNKAMLNKIDGIHVSEKAIGNHTTGAVDGISGEGTTSIMAHLLVVAQLANGTSPVSMEVNDQTRSTLRDYLHGKMSEEDISTIDTALEAAQNDPGLLEAYKTFNQASIEDIKKEFGEKEPAPAAEPESKKAVEPDPGQPVMLAESKEPSDKPDATEAAVTMVEGAPVRTTQLDSKVAPPIGVGVSTMALNPNTMVDGQGRIVTDQGYDAYADNMEMMACHKSTVSGPDATEAAVTMVEGVPVVTDPGYDAYADNLEGEMAVCHKQTDAKPSPTGIQEAFKEAVYYKGSAPLDKIPAGYTSYSLAEVQKMERGRAVGGRGRRVGPDADEQRIIKAVYDEREARLQNNPDYKELQTRLAVAEARVDKIIPERDALIDETAKIAKLIDEMRQGQSTYDGDIEKMPFKFKTVIDGETRFITATWDQVDDGDFEGADECTRQEMIAAREAGEAAFEKVKLQHAAISDIPIKFKAMDDGVEKEFELSYNQIKDHDFPGGVHFWERDDIRAIEEAGLKAFHEKMMGSEKYATLVAQYQENVVALVGEKNAGEIPQDDFLSRFRNKETRMYSIHGSRGRIKYGTFNQEYSDTHREIRQAKMQIAQIEENVDQGATYLVRNADAATPGTALANNEVEAALPGSS